MGSHPKHVSELVTPCFLVDVDVLKANCDRMRQTCQARGVNLRPHMKTHKTIEAGEIMTDGTKRCIAVSTVKEAEFFADAGFADILYAFPFTFDKLPRLQALGERLDEFHVLTDSVHGLDLLEKNPLGKDRKWSVFVKVDCGNKRAGLEWCCEDLPSLVTRLSESAQCTFKGLYAHDGNSYSAGGDVSKLRGIGDDTADKLLQVVELLESKGIKCDTVATGSTPSCSKPGDMMSKLTEFHPGNYIFNDAQQCLVGSCKQKDVACRVATRVVGHYPHRNQLLVDCGFLGLSHDGKGAFPTSTWCIVGNHPELSFVSMTQEIGYITTADDSTLKFSHFPIGSLLYLIPYHACATAAMHPEYYVHSGEEVIDVWKPCRGW